MGLRSSKDWPPAKRRWTRFCQAEFTVYAKDAQIVSLSDDPALDPVASWRIVVWASHHPAQGREPDGVCSSDLKVNPKPERLPISVDVTLRLAGTSHQVRQLVWAADNP